MAPVLEGVRDDHRARYEFAISAGRSCSCTTALDVGCGTGYGSAMLCDAGLSVTAYEIDEEVVAFGEQHYKRSGLSRVCADIADVEFPTADCAVAFEILEHTDAARLVLQRLKGRVGLLIGSVPNQDVVPHSPEKHWQHVRHYSPDELSRLLSSTGWRIGFLGGQKGKRQDGAQIIPDPQGCRTLVFRAVP